MIEILNTKKLYSKNVFWHSDLNLQPFKLCLPRQARYQLISHAPSPDYFVMQDLFILTPPKKFFSFSFVQVAKIYLP
jgi:hypothetical protein